MSQNYDNLGDVIGSTDQNGTSHSYSYDVLGRLTLDAVTSLATGVDGSVMAMGYSFNSLGLPYQQTSYADAAATTIVNQVQDVYNGLGQLTGEYQSHAGAVDSSATPEIQYGYSDPSTGSRLQTMTYPNGKVLTYGYSGNALDNSIGRVDTLSDSTGTLDSYSYLGTGTLVGQSFGDTVHETTTLNPFGQVAEIKYAKGTTATDDFQYSYDA